MNEKMPDPPACMHAAVMEQADALRTLALDLHAHPELAYAEVKACAWQVKMLKRWGFEVETPWAGMPTAYRACMGTGRPAFGLMAEYDALPKIGHGCGHNLICTAALGAAFALSRVMRAENLRGSVVLLGTPAEESGGGKVELMAQDGLRGVDAVIMAHPSHRTVPDPGCTAITRFRVNFKGLSAHAAGSPELGRNALDAVMLLFQGVNAWRQQLPESSRIHGVVSEGGEMPNIIPDSACCLFYLRSPDDRVLRDMTARFKRIVKGAALMTDTEATIEPWQKPYKARWPNRTLNRLYYEAAGACGMEPHTVSRPGRGSSDFGNVSQALPGAHVYFGISHGEIASHSVAFAEASGSAFGLDRMLKAAEALALVGYRYLIDPAVRRAARRDFSADRKGRNRIDA